MWSCVSIEHAELVETELLKNGESVFCVHSKKKESINDLYLDKFENEDIKHITSVVKISEGVDIPPIDCLPFLRPTKSPTLLEQVSGRGMRVYGDKKDCLFLDYGNVVNTLGHPMKPKVNPRKLQRMPSENELKNSYILCPRCFKKNPAIVKACQHCGEVFPELKNESKYKNLKSKAFDPNAEYSVLGFEKQDHKNKKGVMMVKYKYTLQGRMFPVFQYFFIGDYYHMQFVNALSRHEENPQRVTLNEKGFVDKVFFK